MIQFTFENIVILVFSAVGVISAILMITRRSPVTSALYLIANFFSISVIYLMLRSQFIAIIQILVYAGAIMVLFLFVIMLLNLQDESKLRENVTYKKLTGAILAMLMFSVLAITAYFGFMGKMKTLAITAETQGTIESIGRELYTTFSFPFELVSFVLIAAIVGAIVLAQKRTE